MARLFDPSLMPGQYSLEAQSEQLNEEIQETKLKMIEQLKQELIEDKVAQKTLDDYLRLFTRNKKTNVKETFGFYKQLNNGEQGKILLFPDIEEMHTDERFVAKWIEYSAFDAEITFFLRETLA